MSFNNPIINSYRGSFQLDEVYSRTVNVDFPEFAGNVGTYGWWYAGYTGAAILSSVDRVDFSNDTSIASIRGPDFLRYSQFSATSNANYSWQGGGLPPTSIGISSVSKVDFANDLATSAIRGPLSVTRYNFTGAGNLTYGWNVAGTSGSPAVTASSVDRIDYGNDNVVSSVRGAMSAPLTGHAMAGNSNFAWSAGGFTPTIISNIYRIDYSSDLSTSLSRGLLTAARAVSGANTNISYGWFAGGSQPTIVSTVDRLDYSNDTATASVRGTLTAVRNYMSGAGNANYGYLGSGNSPATSGVERITYANDTVTTTAVGALTTIRYQGASSSNYVVARPIILSLTSDTQGLKGFGWMVGGATDNYTASTSAIRRIDFSNDIVATGTRGGLLTTRGNVASSGNSNYSWTAGGRSPSTPALVAYTIVERLDYSNDITSINRGNYLSAAKYFLASLGNANYGWFTAGKVPAVPTTAINSLIERIDYSVDNVSLLPRAFNLSNTTQIGSSGVSNTTYGWFQGGRDNAGSGYTCSIYRLEFSNDLVNTTARGTYSSPYGGNAHAAGLSNSNYGWIAVGEKSGPAVVSDILRIDFSSDLSTSVTRAYLGTARSGASATGNSNYGWFSMGTTPASGNINTIERYDYSNDTTNASYLGGTTPTAYGAGSSSNYVRELQQPFIGGNTFGTYGWAVGGQNSPFTVTSYSYSSRMTYANDTGVMISRTNAPTPVASAASLNTQNYGWSVAGVNWTSPASVPSSAIIRLVYNNDTSTMQVRGNIGTSNYSLASFGNNTYGWATGGWITGVPGNPGISQIFRIEYSNDTANSPIRSFASSSQAQGGGLSDLNFGWTSSAWNSTALSRLSFSNDTISVARGSAPAAVSPFSRSNGVYGWLSGSAAANDTTVYRLDLSNDLGGAVARGTLTRTQEGGSGVGTGSFGWVLGGYYKNTPSSYAYQSAIQRIDFSNDTATAPIRGSMSTSVSNSTGLTDYLQVFPNSNITQYNKGTTTVGTNGGPGAYLWYQGGSTVSTVERIDLYNDGSATSIRGSLSNTRYLGNTMHNFNYSWHGGGYSPAITSTMDRIDYANDGTTAVSRGTLSLARGYQMSASTMTYGYTVGGNTGPAVVTTVDRVDFSNDNTAAVAKGFLITARHGGGPVGNANFSWFGGGAIGSTMTSYLDRITYSSDTNNVVTRNPIYIAKYALAGVSNQNYGWMCGGSTLPTAQSTVDRLDFANDNAGVRARGPLSAARYWLRSGGNANYGWSIGGFPGLTTVDRINYSNDTVQTLLRYGLTNARYAGAVSTDYVK